VIEELVNEYVTAALHKEQRKTLAEAHEAIERLTRAAKADMKQDFERRYTQFQAVALAEVRKLAREEFVATLKAVKGAVA